MARPLKLSATAIARCKRCPTLFRLAHILGIRLVDSTEAQRIGIGWHMGTQLLTVRSGETCPVCRRKPVSFDCPLCGPGEDRIVSEVDVEHRFDRLTIWLEAAYQHIPDNVSPEDWAVERNRLLAALRVWDWYWTNDEVETVATEVPFDIPLVHPEGGHPLRGRFVGVIDRLIRRNGTLQISEFKSTSRNVDSGSTLWNRFRRSTQSTGYILAARLLQRTGALEQYGVKPDEPLVSGVLYDVWHKPSTSLKRLTQKDSAEFLDSKKYYDGRLTVKAGPPGSFFIEGDQTEAMPGKREGTFSIRETPTMYYFRLLSELRENAATYFARREFPHTDQQLKAYQWERFHLYQMILTMKRTGHWYSSEDQCETPWHCEYLPICDNHTTIPDDVELPSGFTRIFSDSKKG